MWSRIAFSVLVFVGLCVRAEFSVAESGAAGNNFPEVNAMDGLSITSPEFRHNEKTPLKFTCDGRNVNPPLKFDGIPQEAKSLVLIMDDPDAPGGTWDHWLLVTSVAQEIEENKVPPNAVLGKNSWGRSDYGGPCPLSGTHRYVFSLYALDTVLDVEQGFSKADLQHAMDGHVLDEAVLVGLYR